MKNILKKLFEHKALTREQSTQTILNIANGRFNDSELASFITVYLMRSITIDELQGFRDGLMEMAVKANLDEFEVMDIVGTGGDGKNTFNISTLSAFIVAGSGKNVAKHGNYGASSVSGASNVMESLGYRFSNDTGKMKRELEQTHFTFLHAPQFHPALRTVAQIRKDLGFRTFFNMLGPLVNPAAPKYQLVGVFSMEMARIYNYMLQEEGKPFTIIHSLDGYDEISLTSDTRVITNHGDQVLPPERLGKRMVSPSDIYGGSTPEQAASLFLKILRGEGTWAQNAVVIANAALALYSTGSYANYDDAYYTAADSLEGGEAYRSFQKLISLQ
jgi:anthranilate phosphoribosyltransferase